MEFTWYVVLIFKCVDLDVSADKDETTEAFYLCYKTVENFRMNEICVIDMAVKMIAK